MPLSLTTLLPICEGSEFSAISDGPQETRSQIQATSDVRIPHIVLLWTFYSYKADMVNLLASNALQPKQKHYISITVW